MPDSYISKFAPIAKKRVVLAANRLVFVIEQIFGSSKKVQMANSEPFMIAQQMLEESHMLWSIKIEIKED